MHISQFSHHSKICRTCRLLSQVRRNFFLNLSASCSGFPPRREVRAIIDAILYTPMVGHSIQYLAHATLSYHR